MFIYIVHLESKLSTVDKNNIFLVAKYNKVPKTQLIIISSITHFYANCSNTQTFVQLSIQIFHSNYIM